MDRAHAPLLVESFPKRPKTLSEASLFGGSHKYKQNKQTTLLHRWMLYIDVRMCGFSLLSEFQKFMRSLAKPMQSN
jgi:hypothetical protein